MNLCIAALTSVLLAPPPPAPGPALEQEAVVYRDLQARSGLDLDDVWTDYLQDRRAGEGFYEFTRARYRRRLGAGLGLSVAGLGLSAAGMALLFTGLERGGDSGEIDVIGGALVLTAGLTLLIPGTILWPINQVRLHKLKQAHSTARLQLRAAGPVPLQRGLGLGLGLAF